MNTFQYNFRTSEENWMWLHHQENATKRLNDFIDHEREKESTSQYCDEQIKYFQNKIKEWQEKKQRKPNVDDSKIQGILDQAINEYQTRLELVQQDPGLRPHFTKGCKEYIRIHIIPQLKEAGRRDLSIDKIFEMCESGRINLE